ncbi:hypothetical protein PINS_up011960 [Pythium insidiosum]|nr:hypothetical protein PINS_up011960 [Pythium insidiosum]
MPNAQYAGGDPQATASADELTPRAPLDGIELSLAPRRGSGVHQSMRRLSQSLAADDGFASVFGVLGIPMLAAFVSSALTLLYLAMIQLFPTAAANALMNTRELDNDEFWLLSQASPPLVALATAMLLAFSLAYLALAVFMLFFREYALPKGMRKRKRKQPRLETKDPSPPDAKQPATASVQPQLPRQQRQQQQQKIKPRRRTVPMLRRQSSVLRELLAHDGAYHAYFVSRVLPLAYKEFVHEC